MNSAMWGSGGDDQSSFWNSWNPGSGGAFDFGGGGGGNFMDTLGQQADFGFGNVGGGGNFDFGGSPVDWGSSGGFDWTGSMDFGGGW